jgi:hypothetical protein
MKTLRLLISVALISATWARPACAASIDFVEVSEGATILVQTSGLGLPVTISAASESASVTVGTTTATSVPLLSIGLTQPGSNTEGGGTGVSDLITARAFVSGSALTGAFQVSFQSDTEVGLSLPVGVVTTLIPETGLPQVVFSGSLPLLGIDLTITALSDLEPVPEPTTLLLWGSSLTGLGLARWRWRKQR